LALEAPSRQSSYFAAGEHVEDVVDFHWRKFPAIHPDIG
jgi:hypothetical protein